MSTKIKGSEFPLAKIFSSDFDYNIPSFQRPYSWTEDQTRELFNDLHDFYVEESSEEQYFLGSIVLVKEDDKPHSEVIDGQQRLTTLTILLAALTSRLTGDNRADFKNYIIEPGRASQGIVPKPRLQLRKVDNPFFCTYVQEMQFDKLFGLNPDMLPTEAQQNILLNAKLLMDLLVANFASEAELVRFGAFLVQRCLLIVVSTPTEQSAFRIFSVMNNRGMDLLVTDIIKADVIGAITPDSRQQDYNEKWESLEIQLGRSGFNDLFGHIRMIRMKAKAKKSLQEEFYKFVLPAITCPMIKINKGIEPVELTKYKQQPNASYRDMHGAPSGKSNSDGTPIDVYTIVLNRLIQEQGCICAYCMCRIPEKGKKATIEHIDPQSATSEEKALDYRNMLAVCNGNRDAHNDKEKSCDAHRKNAPLSVNPLKSDTLSSLKYLSNGEITASDDAIKKDLCDTLNLNCSERRIPENRKAALTAYLRVFVTKHPTGDIKESCRRELEKYQQESPKMPYVGIILDWLTRHT